MKLSLGHGTEASVELKDSGLSIRLQAVCRVAIATSRVILAIYAEDDPGTLQKNDDSPVTRADWAAHALLIEALPQIAPCLPVISEESAEASNAVVHRHYWLVDPLDGTREFIQKNGEFTVNIAEIIDGGVGLCVLAVPVKNQLYAREASQVWRVEYDDSGEIARIDELSAQAPHTPWRVALSRRARAQGGSYPLLMDHLQERQPPPQWVQAGSAYKFALMAEGQIDIYPRLHPTSEWDTAAGQGILEALGGRLMDGQGRPFVYGQRQTLLNGPFLALRCGEDWRGLENFWMDLHKTGAS